MFGEKNSLLRVYVGVAKPEAHATKGNQPLITGFPLLKGVGYNKHSTSNKQQQQQQQQQPSVSIQQNKF